MFDKIWVWCIIWLNHKPRQVHRREQEQKIRNPTIAGSKSTQRQKSVRGLELLLGWKSTPTQGDISNFSRQLFGALSTLSVDSMVMPLVQISSTAFTAQWLAISDQGSRFRDFYDAWACLELISNIFFQIEWLDFKMPSLGELGVLAVLGVAVGLWGLWAGRGQVGPFSDLLILWKDNNNLGKDCVSRSQRQGPCFKIDHHWDKNVSGASAELHLGELRPARSGG